MGDQVVHSLGSEAVMSGFYQDPEEDQSYRKTLIIAIFAVSIVLLLFLAYLAADKEQLRKKAESVQTVSREETEEAEEEPKMRPTSSTALAFSISSSGFSTPSSSSVVMPKTSAILAQVSP